MPDRSSEHQAQDARGPVLRQASLARAGTDAVALLPMPDGQRFLVREPASSSAGVEQLHIILNWPAAAGYSF